MDGRKTGRKKVTILTRFDRLFNAGLVLSDLQPDGLRYSADGHISWSDFKEHAPFLEGNKSNLQEIRKR